MDFGKLRERFFASICLGCIIFIISCEIGLGSAVDVSDPTIDISYPPKNAVVRDSFIAAGECNDDTEISGVEVTIYNPETSATFGPYEATIDDEGKTWSVLLNQRDESQVNDSFDSYKQWEYPDGNYIISAIAYDVEGKASPYATSPVSIDNTPPVLIVSKPLAIGSQPATIYGNTFKLSGDIAEEHETSKLVVYYKQYDANTGAVISGGREGSIEITDSAELNAMSSSNPLIIAQFNSAGNLSEQHSNYVSLYGSSADDVDRYYYSGFMLEDNAHIYQVPGDNGSGDGNQTQQYYLLGNDFQTNLAVNYSLTALKLMGILRGNSEEYSASEIQSISASLLAPGNYASSTWVSDSEASKFSLNPHNNPTWSLGEYGVEAGDDQFEQYTSGSSLVLTLKAGRDASFPDPRTVRVYLYDLTIFNEANDPEHNSPLPPEDFSITGKTPVCLIGPDGAIAESWDESADDSTKNYTFVLDSESFTQIEKDHYYRMTVAGSDRNKTDLEPEGQLFYIFRFTTSNSIPRVTITAPEDDATLKGGVKDENDEWVDGVNKDGVTICGHINTDGVALKAGEEITVSRLDVSEVTNTVTFDRGIGNYDVDLVSLTPDTTVPHQYNFELKLTAKDDVDFVPSGTSEDSKYLYIATLRAKDRTDLSGEKKVKFYVDNKKPLVSINEPSPKTDDGFVNGKITISGNASDSGIAGSGLKSLRYVIRNNLNDTVPVKSGNIPLSESWSFDVETKDLTSSEASYYVIVEAEDAVGNKNIDLDSSTPIVHTAENPNPAVKLINVKQSTDTPKLNLTNAHDTVTSVGELSPTVNMFGTSSNNKLYGSITDDDGLESVTVSWQKIGSSENGPHDDVLDCVAGSKSYNFEYTLPDVQGQYNITINAADNKHETSADSLEKTFVITVDNGAPVFSNVTPQITSSSYYMGSKEGDPKTLPVSGTVSDGNGLNTSEGFTVKHYKKNGSVWPDNPDTSDTKPVSTLATPAVSPATTGTFTDIIQLPSADGVYKVEYTAKDIYNQTSVYPVEYSVDVTAPAFAEYDSANSTQPAMVGTSPVTGSTRIGWIHDNNVNVAAFVYDPEVSGVKSGIGSVSYSLVENPGETDWTDMTHSVSEDTVTSQKWIGSVQFIDGEEKVLKLRVKDTVGNETPLDVNVKVDRTKPVLDVRWYQITDGTVAGTSSFFTPSGSDAYVNNKNMVIYGNYSDGTDCSGVNPPEFKIAGAELTAAPTITYYDSEFSLTASTKAEIEESISSVTASENVITYSTDTAKNIKSFKAVIPYAAYGTAGGLLTVSGSDIAENDIENNNRTIVNLVKDDLSPEVNVANITKAYRAQNGKYFIRNVTDGTITITGTSTDNYDIDKTVLTITGEESHSYTAESTSTAWNFSGIDLSGWPRADEPTDPMAAAPADATITVTAFDKAGNTRSSSSISLVFDEGKPAVLTGIPDSFPEDWSAADFPNPSDEGDTSNPFNSDYTLRGTPAWKYSGISIGPGKYGDTSYGREASILVGVTFIGEKFGSGISKMEYKMLSASHAEAYRTLSTGIYGAALPSENWTKEGQFAISSAASDLYYTHFNDAAPKPHYPCFKGSTTINGFESTTAGVPNILFVKATDNCGNESDWFTLLIQMDNENPEIVTDNSNPDSLLTNGQNTLPVLKGVFKEGAYSSGLKASRVYINGVLAIDGNFTRTPASGLTVHAYDKNGVELTGWTTNSTVYNDAVEVSFTNDYGTLKYKGYAPTEAQWQNPSFVPDSSTPKCSFMDAASYATWELVLTPQEGTWFSSLPASSSPQISIEAEDWANDTSSSGNKANIVISSFEIDTTKPSVLLSSPVCNAGESVNGKHSINGYITENHTIESIGIYYLTTSTSTAALPGDRDNWTHYKTLTAKEQPSDPAQVDANTEYGVTLQSIYNFDFEEEFDFNALIGSASSGYVHILTYAVDKAGNSNVSPDAVTETKPAPDNSYVAIKTYSVDRNSDRPVVTITNTALVTTNTEGAAEPIARTNLKQVDTRTINVSVADDDGVGEVQYRVTKIAANPDDDITGSWTTLTLTSGSGVIRINEDGDHFIEFKVKDNDNNWFESKPADNDSFKKIYLAGMESPVHKYGTNTAGYENPVAYLRVDTEAPSLEVKKIKLLGTEADNTSVEWITPNFSNYVVGGDSKSYLRVQVEATDIGTGIKDVKISAKLDGDDVSTVTASTAPGQVSNSLYELVIPCRINGVSKENVSFVATITAEDNSGKKRSETMNFKADNKVPTITINSPSSTTHLSGSVTADGQFSESVKVEYAISPLEASPDTYTSTTEFSYVKYNNDTPVSPAVNLPANDKSGHAITLSQGLDSICAYQPMNASAPDVKMMSFYLWFDGKTDGLSSGIHSETLNTWIKNLGITTQEDLTSPTDSFDDIIRLYLHIKATDNAGNKNEVHYPILLNPQGSRPIVTIGYPAADVAGETTEGITLCGAPSIIGTSTGVNAVNYVWLQIDCNADNAWTVEDFNLLQNQKDSADNYIYDLGNMDTRELITTQLAAGTNVSRYGIRAGVNGIKWSLQINQNKELDPPEGQTKVVKIWANATDDAGFISRQEIRKIILDSKAPTIDQNIRLVQWNSGYNGSNGFNVDSDGNITFTTGAVSAIRAYNENENIKGRWFLIGKVSDESGIKKVSFKVNGGSLERAITNSEEGYTGSGTNEGAYIRRYTGNNYIFCLPIGNDAENSVGEYAIDFTAEEIEDSNPRSVERTFIVLYDNKAPVVETKLVGITAAANVDVEMMNSNGVYTFSGITSEDKVDGVSQTGVDRIAFFFTRNITSQATKIFDPMIRAGRTGNIQDYSSMTPEYGLYWQSATVDTSIDSDTNHGIITLPAGTSFVNIHKGGLVKVNGVIYTIKGIDEAARTVSFDGNAGVTTGVTALFAIANVVDNPTRESTGDSIITADYGYGYYSKSSPDQFDDGDYLVESLVGEGTKYTWDVSINSRNISDGPVTLHYVVFDKAGNVSAVQEQNFFIKNNAPRLAGIVLGTDENGNGSVDSGEFVSSYSGMYEGGYNGNNKMNTLTVPPSSTATAPLSVIKIKGKTVINPEIIGGNGTVNYTYTVSKRNAADNDWASPYKSVTTPVQLGDGTAENDEGQVSLNAAGGIVIDVIDFLSIGIADGENQKFTFSISDSTPGHAGVESQNATLNVIMDVALNDETSATNKIIPFYWKSPTENSLKDGSLAKGHIELSKDLPSAFTSTGTGIYSLRPKVSGAVKLEGIAQDNSLLSSISVTINNGTSQTTQTIATYSTEGNPENPWTLNTGTGWSSNINNATFEELIAAGYISESELPADKELTDYVPYTSQEYGHVVHWTMVVDTELMGITPQTGVEISAAALDKGKPTLSGTGDTATVEYTANTFEFNGDSSTTLASIAQSGGDRGSGTQTCKYLIDVVPYIRGIKTMLSTKTSKEDSSEYDRTALGHYPASNTEEIYLYGFNLAGCTLFDSKTPAANSLVLGTADTTSFASQELTVYKTNGAITNFISGPVLVKYGTGENAIESLNNLNDNNAKGNSTESLPVALNYGEEESYEALRHFYNRMPNEVNNCILTDDVILDVWNINSDAAKPNPNGRTSEPIIKVNPDSGIIGFSFLSGPMKYSMPKGKNNSYNGEMQGTNDGDAQACNGFAYDSEGWSYGFDVGGNEGAAYYFRVADAAGNVLKLYNADGKEKAWTIDRANDNGRNLRYKLKSPSIAVTVHADENGAQTRNVYMAYFNSDSNQIRFRNGTIDANKTPSGLIIGDEGNATTTKYSQVIACVNTANYNNGGDSDVPATPLGGASKYVCLDVTSDADGNDVVVIVWYDLNDNSLKYSYNTNPTATEWRDNTAVGEANRGRNRRYWHDAQTIFTDAGQYCQIAVDKNKGIHIAAHDLNNHDVRYAYLSSYDDDYDEETDSCIVDSYGNVGAHMRMDIALNSEGLAVPYISYVGSGMPKLAYLKDPARTDGTVNDMFTGVWEVTYIPTKSDVLEMDEKENAQIDNRVNVALWKDKTTGVIKNSVPGTSSSAAGSGTCWGNGTPNPVVGYEIAKDSTNSRIETAQMQ